MPNFQSRLHGHRRGALLLLVLSMLTLFLMIGALMLVIATRTRAAARAFTEATTGSSVGDASARKALDEALMVLLRGSDGSLPAAMSESLLEDKYGPGTLTGNITFSPNPQPGTAAILTGTITSLNSGTVPVPVSPPSRLNGRVLTLKPVPGAGDCVSFRILAADSVGSGTTTVYLANVPFRPGMTLPTATCAVRINGREFTPLSGTTAPEAYDAADDQNTWLARPVVANGQVVAFPKMSFLPPGSTPSPSDSVDNDGDGVIDGSKIPGNSNFLRSQPSPFGGNLSYKVSYLVLDLDGRLNVNTAGMADRARGAYSGGVPPEAPLGLGYGPADLDASLVISGSLPSANGLSAFTGAGNATPPGAWPRLLVGGTPSPTSLLATDSQRRPPPQIGAAGGRYGPDAAPGVAGDDNPGNQQTNSARYVYLIGGTTWSGAGSLNIGGTTGNSVTDLKGHLKAYVTAPLPGQITPTLNFFAPVPAAFDFMDDPYESRVDGNAPRHTVARNAATARNDDNPFTLADLERVLRPSDGDATTLPPRLAALLENRAQALRMAITTDSWDTPVLTGSAARQVEDYIATTGTGALAYPWAAANVYAPDIAAGLKFDVNRLIMNQAQAQEYCRGLYTLAMALGETNPARAAQWAVNVLDFRDEDSTMTRFVYDTNLSDGWNLSTSGTVFGVERPDLMMTETAAWSDGGTGQLFVTLHRPAWTAFVTGSTGPLATRERLASELGGGGNLDIAMASGPDRVWQLRFDTAGTDSVVQFHALTTGTTQSQHLLRGGSVQPNTVNVLGSNAAAAPLAAGGYLCVHSPTPQNFTVAVAGHAIGVTGAGGGFRRTASGTVFLERLANPLQPNGPDNPYVVVDRAPVVVIPDPPPGGLYQKQRRPGPTDAATAHPLAQFWRGAGAWQADAPSLGTYSAVSSLKPAAWLHWPNRPFVSHGELALVPSDTAENFLANYSFPTSSLATGTSTVGQGLLDAMHVPTRFAENSITITNTTSDPVGLYRLGINHFPTWREPGKVNVNTIVSGSGTTVDTDSLVWATLIGDTQMTLAGTTITVNPFTSGLSPSPAAKSIAQLLSLDPASGRPVAEQTFSSGTTLHPRDKNPFFAHATAIRLANTATVRSHVFAVWITLEITDDSATGPPPTYRRLFAIIDRSIPVGYSRGEDLNVRDTIRVLRYLD